MRPTALLLLSLSLLLPLHAQADSPPAKPAPPSATQKASKLELFIDKSKVDLEGHQLEVKLSRPAQKIKVTVISETRTTLAEVEQAFDGTPAGTSLVVSWTPSSTERVARIEVWGYDTEGYYVGMAIIPWNVEIPHEEVNFENDSDVIRPSEVPKLEASLQLVKDALAKYKEIGNIMLFIQGHTDTMATAEYNLGLSRRRARAISAWFRSHGLRIPIAYEGMGEFTPLVKTGDNVSEPRNRRVDYILALEQPRLPASPVAFSWKGI
jgi:outer membrane protein OmpA-like peptidoglycan-associated protein